MIFACVILICIIFESLMWGLLFDLVLRLVRGFDFRSSKASRCSLTQR